MWQQWHPAPEKGVEGPSLSRALNQIHLNLSMVCFLKKTKKVLNSNSLVLSEKKSRNLTFRTNSKSNYQWLNTQLSTNPISRLGCKSGTFWAAASCACPRGSPGSPEPSCLLPISLCSLSLCPSCSWCWAVLPVFAPLLISPIFPLNVLSSTPEKGQWR